ncbi:MAG TPA: BatA and WFA domain-containing protein, partial [bacterium]|nr:BatA and WFA domain-containing protein [bacterium]
MQFADPLGLWLLAFLPLVMVLYMLKLRRQRQVVASTLLWRRLFEDVQANAFWQKLRRNLQLLLQLLAVTLLAIGYARPTVPAGVIYGTDLIVVLDNSGSMRAREGPSTRFALARDRVMRLVDGLGPRDSLTLIITAPRPKVVVSNETDRARIREELAAVPVSGSGALAEALAVAHKLQQADGGRFTYVFSDGEARDLPLGDAPEADELWIPCGTAQPNLAIVRADVRQAAPGVAPQLLVSVSNHAGGPAAAMLRLYAGERLIEAREEQWQAGERRTLMFAVQSENEERLKLELAYDDALADDNVAFLVSRRYRPLRVAVAGAADGLIARSLSALPDVAVTLLTADSTAADATDLTVWEEDGPPAEVGGAHCVLAPVPGRWGTTAAADSRPQVVAWDRVHGPLARCNLNRLYIAAANPLAVPETGRVLVRGSGGPL